MADQVKSSARKWLTLVIVAFAGGLITKLPYLRETYMDPLAKATGATMTQLGLLMSAYGIVNFICYFPGGVLADKLSSRALITFSCIGTALAGFWYYMMPGFMCLIVIHAVFAVTTVFTFWAAMVKVINNLGGPEQQGRLFGSLEGGRGLIGTLAAFGSVIVFNVAGNDIGGMKNTILYYSVGLVLAGVLAFFFLGKDTETVKTEKEKSSLNWKDFMEVAKMPRVWLCGLLGVCNYSALIFHGYITGYMSEAFDLSAGTVAVLNTIRTYGMMMIGAFVAGLISDKVGSRIKFITRAFIGMAVFATLYLVIPAGPKVVSLVVANFICYGLFLYSIKALYFSTIDEVNVPKRLAGTASGVISLVTYSVEMFLYTVSGAMVDKYLGTDTPLAGYRHCWISMVLLSMAGFVFGFMLLRMNKKTKDASLINYGEGRL